MIILQKVILYTPAVDLFSQQKIDSPKFFHPQGGRYISLFSLELKKMLRQVFKNVQLSMDYKID